MKTTINAQKTESRIMIALSFAAILTFAFLNSSGKSHESSKFQTHDFTSENSIEFKFIPEIETQLLLALTNPNDLSKTSELKGYNDAFWIEEEQDEILKIESWMLNQKLFKSNETIEQIEEEKQLEIEGWMTKPEFWR